ncbi:regulator of telomere elongation helicase 1 homolog [Xenia sp. Carnegie-2017]|uniref:regulator of telomere elongation helicase 1 homolog n=1 Tax=Xenia sp. Carnegie-2017 TaxID=2897299 RepID=UPI001F038FBD|nr:regulator of telomere elongation helicase 1 homolog [Xenia sp. Carnegie-2017]
MLVFFPTYTSLEVAVQNWKTKSNWPRLKQRKPIFIEPRRNVEFAETMDGFYEKVKSTEFKGAMFLALCRGKIIQKKS